MTGNAVFSPQARRTLVVLAIALLVPLVIGFGTDDERRSAWERRTLQAWPAWPGLQEAGAYFERLSTFADDHVGLALEANRLYSQLRYYVFGDDPVDNVTAGRDGFLFLSSQGRASKFSNIVQLCVLGVDPSAIEREKAAVATLSTSLKSRGYLVSFAIAPTKLVIYPDYLPDRVPKSLRAACSAFRDRPNVPQALADSTAADGRLIYYPLDEFIEARDLPGFYPKANFHWSGYSAHLFAKGILRRLGIEVGEEFEKEARLENKVSDLKGLIGFRLFEPMWTFPYADYGVQRLRQKPDSTRTYYANATDFAEFRTDRPASQRTALLITNSFGAFLAPHLAPGFAALYQINIGGLKEDEYEAFMGAFIDQLDVTDVMFLFHDRGFANGAALSLLSETARSRKPTEAVPRLSSDQHP